MKIKQTIIGMTILVVGYLIIIGTFKGSMWAMSLTDHRPNPVKIELNIK